MQPLGGRNGPPVQLVSANVDDAKDSWLASWMLATYRLGQVLVERLGSLAQRTVCSSLWLCLQASVSKQERQMHVADQVWCWSIVRSQNGFWC